MMKAVYVLTVSILCLIAHRVETQTCQNAHQYEECSSNIACGCFPLTTVDNGGICGYLHISCSELNRCFYDNRTCFEPNHVCVMHPQCDSSEPLCYPMNMANTAMCPAKSSITTTPTVIHGDGICLSATWNQTGVPVTGLSGYGTALNQLKFPSGIFLDNDDVLYVADKVNHRVVKWMPGASSGQLVAGGNEIGNNANQFNYLTSIVVGKNGTMFICDTENDRVQRWLPNDNQGQTIIQNFSCWGVAMDKEESLYVSHFRKHYVLKWPANQVVAGGNEEGKKLNQLAYPSQLFIDREQSVLVADLQNDRIMKWPVGAKEGIVVAGGNGIGSDPNQLSQPSAAVVDDMGTVYVVDSWNNRIVRWPKGAKSGTVIIDGKNGNDDMTKFSTPEHLTFDRYGNLYVADTGSHRVLKFAIDKSSCV